MNNTLQNIKLDSISPDDLPEIISEKASQLANLQKNVNTALAKAKAAKEQADKLTGYHRGPLGGKRGSTKLRVEDLQGVVKSLADSQLSETDAMEASFIFQQKLAETTEWLFFHGCQNIANNEAMIKYLNNCLNGTQYNDFSEEAKKALNNVINRLKVQKDLLFRQEQIAEKTNENEKRIQNIESALKTKTNFFLLLLFLYSLSITVLFLFFH